MNVSVITVITLTLKCLSRGLVYTLVWFFDIEHSTRNFVEVIVVSRNISG